MHPYVKEIFSTKIDSHRRKDTGMAIVLILLVMFLWLENILFAKLSLVALIVNMTFPILFHPIAVLWFALSIFLGTIVSRIFLTIIYFVLVTPVGLLRKLLRRDSLQLRQFKKSNKSVMIERNVEFTKEHLDNPY